MEFTASAMLAVDTAPVRAAVADLGTYPAWLTIVLSADPAPDGAAGAWIVEIGARLGPVRQAKKLRMVRSVHHPDLVVFERHELDGREHSPWVMRVGVTPAAGGCRLDVHLFYGGSLPLPFLDRVLAGEVRRAPARLRSLLAG